MKTYFFLLLIPFLFFSCKKEESTSPVSVPINQVPEFDFLSESGDKAWFFLDADHLGLVKSFNVSWHYGDEEMNKGLYFIKTDTAFEEFEFTYISNRYTGNSLKILYNSNGTIAFKISIDGQHKVFRSLDYGNSWVEYWQDNDEYDPEVPLSYLEDGTIIYIFYGHSDYWIEIKTFKEGVNKLVYRTIEHDLEMFDVHEKNVFLITKYKENGDYFGKKYLLVFDLDKLVTSYTYVYNDELSEFCAIDKKHLVIIPKLRQSYLSTENTGINWLLRSNFPDGYKYAEKLYFVKSNSSYQPSLQGLMIFAIINKGKNNEESNFYVTRNNGDSWELPSDLKIDAGLYGTLIQLEKQYLIYGNNNLYYSGDYGRTWKQILQ